jgi:hypothetical protein
MLLYHLPRPCIYMRSQQWAGKCFVFSDKMNSKGMSLACTQKENSLSTKPTFKEAGLSDTRNVFCTHFLSTWDYWLWRKEHIFKIPKTTKLSHALNPPQISFNLMYFQENHDNTTVLPLALQNCSDLIHYFQGYYSGFFFFWWMVTWIIFTLDILDNI